MRQTNLMPESVRIIIDKEALFNIFPVLSSNDILAYLLQYVQYEKDKNKPENDECNKRVFETVRVDTMGWPEIHFFCVDNVGNEETIVLSENKFRELLRNIGFLSYVRKYADKDKEYVPPFYINKITLGACCEIFKRNEKGEHSINLKRLLDDEGKKFLWDKYEIKNVYRDKDTKILASHSYTFGVDNYAEAAIAIAEISGRKCGKERLHQLKYYYRKGAWGKLKQTLFFLLDLPVNYAPLVFALFKYAKKQLFNEFEEQLSSELMEILETALETVTRNKEKYDLENVTTAFYELTELMLVKLELLNVDKTADKDLLETLKEQTLSYAFFGRHPVLNSLFLELAGLNPSEKKIIIDTKSPEKLLLEAAKATKALNEENHALKQEIDSLKGEKIIAGSTEDLRQTSKGLFCLPRGPRLGDEINNNQAFTAMPSP